MKRLFICLLSLLLTVSLFQTVSAKESPTSYISSPSVFITDDGLVMEAVSETIDTLPDGSFIVTTLYEETENHARSTVKTVGKTQKRYRSDQSVVWEFTLIGTFVYNGSTAACTATSYSHAIYDSSWTMHNPSTWKSGATANGSATFTNGTSTAYPSLTITCSKTGDIS